MYVCAQSCLTLCSPMDCSPPGPSVHGIFYARILQWGAISFSRGSSQTRDWTPVSYISCIGRWILPTGTTVTSNLQQGKIRLSVTWPFRDGLAHDSSCLLCFGLMLFCISLAFFPFPWAKAGFLNLATVGVKVRRAHCSPEMYTEWYVDPCHFPVGILHVSLRITERVLSSVH